MARRHDRKKKDPKALAHERFQAGKAALAAHPLFQPLLIHATIYRGVLDGLLEDGWAVARSNGQVLASERRLGAPDEWMYVLAHCLLHFGFGHFQNRPHPFEWNVACDCIVTHFLSALKLGRPPHGLSEELILPSKSEDGLYEHFLANGVPAELAAFGTAGTGVMDMVGIRRVVSRWEREVNWQECFAKGLALAASRAVHVAAGVHGSLFDATEMKTGAQSAMAWFVSSYPLLGALAASFKVVEDLDICHRLEISVAAVDPQTREVFMNPTAGLDSFEIRFVMAHELLHVGLRHDTRRQGRDAFVWNVACDYVINGWLVEMGLGELPKVGGLYDPELKGLSAEAVYDRLVTDLRRYRRISTLRGAGLVDILSRGTPDWWLQGDGIPLDEFYRRCLTQGLAYHEDAGRGFLPAGLVEEIRALSRPAIAWDVELAHWFDGYFQPLNKVRSYSRPSRRQSATPDIPRPRHVYAEGAEDGRTFGVVLDTSGSMDRSLLAKALGAIASYGMSRDVPAVRVVFCDAAAYDCGYISPEDIAGRVKIKGRGGTVLQPGVDLLEKAEDFPKDGPILLITDGQCDRLQIRREHAFLIPEGRHLPFVPKGKVFRLR